MANKRGPLSKAETFYVQEHIKLGKAIDEIAADLDRPAKSIEKCAAKAKKETSSSTTARITAGDQFIKQRGAVVMTQNASTMGDVRRGNTKPTSSNCISKIKQDK